MIDERQMPRSSMSWPARLWLGPECALVARVVEAGARRVRLVLLTWVPGEVFTMGASYRLEIDHPRLGGLRCEGDVRSVRLGGIGLELHEPLPAELLAGGCPPEARAGEEPESAGPADRETMLVLQQLAALIRAWRPAMSDIGQRSIGEALESLVLDACTHGALRQWDAAGQTLAAIERLSRLAVRMGELPVGYFAAIQTVLRVTGETIGFRHPERSSVAL